MVILQLVMGVALLLAGRRVFWFLVGCAGFLIGLRLAQYFVPPENQHLTFIIGVAAGVLCVLLTLFAKKLAIGVAGFVIGAFIAMQFSQLFGVEQSPRLWLLLIVGGAIGAVFFSVIFNLSLILFSSCVGALLILQSVRLQPAAFSFLFILLSTAGIIFQTKLHQKLGPHLSKIKF